MKEKEWSYSELEKEAIKDFKKSRVDMIRGIWRSHEQEKDAIANQPQEVVHKSTGIMKPLDIVRTPKGDIGIIGETNDKGTKASIDFIKGCNEGRSHNAWWSEGDGLVILDNLPRLLADAMKHPFGRGREDVEHFFGNEEEIKNGLNTKENELPTPRGHKEVCPHPANQVFMLNGWYRCEACNGKWKSKIK